METKEKAEATRAAKARAAEIRRQLDELRQEDQDGDVSKSESLDQPITKADMGSFFASSLQSAVKKYFIFFYTIYTVLYVQLCLERFFSGLL